MADVIDFNNPKNKTETPNEETSSPDVNPSLKTYNLLLTDGTLIQETGYLAVTPVFVGVQDENQLPVVVVPVENLQLVYVEKEASLPEFELVADDGGDDGGAA